MFCNIEEANGSVMFQVTMAVLILQSTGMWPWNLILLWRYQYYNLQWLGPEIWYCYGGINITIYRDVTLKLILLWRYQYCNLQGCYPEILYYYGGMNITIYSDVPLKFGIFVAVSILKCTVTWPWNLVLLWWY